MLPLFHDFFRIGLIGGQVVDQRFGILSVAIAQRRVKRLVEARDPLARPETSASGNSNRVASTDSASSSSAAELVRCSAATFLSAKNSALCAAVLPTRTSDHDRTT